MTESKQQGPTPSPTPNDPSKKRYFIVDEMRGFAVLLMIIFHFAFDLMIFGYVDIDFQKDLFWFLLPRIIVFLFLFCVGISLSLLHRQKILWPKFWRRWGQLVIFAFIISLSTYFMFPDRWIYWGTLHCIAFCSLAALPFLKRPRLALALALPMLILALFFNINIPWILLPHRSMDYIAPFPWLAVTLLGIYAYSIHFHRLELPRWKKLSRPLRFMGRHALFIYILHQPFMFGVFKLIQI